MSNIRVGRRSGLVLRGGRQRRQSLWLQAVSIADTLASASSATLLFSLNAAGLALRPFTLVRSRGYVMIRSDQEISDEVQDYAYGNIVVSDEAVAAGVAAVPTPALQPSSDWHVYVRFSRAFQLGTAVGFEPDFGRMLEFDSKAMRKVDLGEDLIGVHEASAISDGLIAISFVRVLVKLH